MEGNVSEVEIIRFIAALLGLWVGWTGARKCGKLLGSLADPDPTEEDESVWDEHDEREDRLRTTRYVQMGIVLCHLYLFVNVVNNFSYPSPPFTQSNVLTSNLMQVLIPITLIAVSKRLSDRIDRAEKGRARIARRTRQTQEVTP